MSDISEISSRVQVSIARQKFVEEAARKAAAETGPMNASGEPFCDLTYIQSAMFEAEQAFDRQSR